jgi:hypothetical protein
LPRLATSFVLGYHGCDLDTASRVIRGLEPLQPSDKPYDWLGPGIYFWEADYQRAREWAVDRCKETGGEPAVVGAAIDLGNCLDLLSRMDQELLRGAYASLKALYDTAELPMPENEPSRRGKDEYRRVRRLDCAVIKNLHETADDPSDDSLAPFDTVRGMFTEGDLIYPGGSFHDQSHVQIAVRNAACIKGYFLPPELGQKV